MRIDRIKFYSLLMQKDLTLTDLSNSTGITCQTLSAIKQGKRCSKKTAERIASALGIDIGEIMEGQNEKA